MSDDPRCCGTGTCIINAEGLCWCGQRWDGEKMCFMSEPAAQPKATLRHPHPAPGRIERMSAMRLSSGRCALFPPILFCAGPRP